MTKLLILASTPTDLVHLNLHREIREISKAIRSSPFGSQFEIEVWLAVRQRDLLEDLETAKPDLIHFCGHGEKTSELVLEDDFGRFDRIPQDILSEIFSLLKDVTQCVVFNACYTEASAYAISNQIPYVIGMQEQIEDSLAIAFAREFYRQLASGSDLKKAFESAQLFLKEQRSIVRLHASEAPIKAAEKRFVRLELTEQEKALKEFLELISKETRIPQHIEVLEEIVEVLCIQGKGSGRSFAVLAKAFNAKGRVLALPPKIVVETLISKVKYWSDSIESFPERREHIDFFIGYALITIANMSVVNEIDPGKSFIREWEKALNNKDPKLFGKLKIPGSIRSAAEIIEQNKPDYLRYPSP